MPQGGISTAGRSDLARLVGRGRRFVTVADAAAALGVSSRVAAQKLARWSELGWLRRVRRGLYIPVPVEAENPDAWSEDPVSVAAVVWGPCYFTGWTAASHWGLTEQIFRTTVLKSAQRVRTNRQRLMEHDYVVEHVAADAMWGTSAVWRQEQRVLFADPARTVIDVLDEPHLAGGIRSVGDVLSRYLDENDPKTLIMYGDKLANAAVFKRLGYLLETLGLGHFDLVDAARSRLAAGISLLDPSAAPSGLRVPRWSLRANVRVGREDPS